MEQARTDKVSTPGEDGAAALKELAHLRQRRISLRLRLRSEDSSPRSTWLDGSLQEAVERGEPPAHFER